MKLRRRVLVGDDALAAAQDLVAGGAYAKAIELLTAANRQERDARIELELVDLRYRAFAQSTAPATPPAPATVPDLFPGSTIPEIDGRDLSVERVQSAIEHHGSIIVRRLVDPDRVNSLVGDIDRVFDAFDAHREKRELPERDEWYRPFKYEPLILARVVRREAGGVLALDSPRITFNTIEMFEECGIGDLVRGYFSEPPALLARKWTLRRIPHDAGRSDWHQDGAFMGKEIRSLDVWIALSHCGDDAPGIDLVGRRLDEIAETGTHGARMSWTVSPDVVEEVAAGSITRPIFEPGDALLFDHMNLHCTAIDPGMTRDRYAIETWFFAPSTYDSMLNQFDNDDGPISDQIPIVY